MPSITSSSATPSPIAGEPLLNAAGGVVGILYDPDPGSSPATFLPSDLVVGVADDLRSQNRVVHGWLGVQGTDAPDDAGAKVAQVQSGGPASGRLQAGQLIVAVNATPVRTMAELRARLYVLPPGTRVDALGPAAGRDQGRGRHPRHVLLACEGEHVRFQRPRQPDGGPPRRPDEGHRLGAGVRRQLVRGRPHPGLRGRHRRRRGREPRPAGAHRLRGAGPRGRAARGRGHRDRARFGCGRRLLRGRRARGSGASASSRPTGPSSSPWSRRSSRARRPCRRHST